MKNYNLLTTEEQLVELLDSKNRLPLIFSFTELTDTENIEWTERIKKNYLACGCDTGSTFMGATFLLLLAVLLLNILILKKEVSYVSYLYGLAFVFLMAVVGKVVGKKLSYFKFKRDIYQLKAILKMNCHQQGVAAVGTDLSI